MSTFEVMKAETVKTVSASQEFADCINALARYQSMVPNLVVSDAQGKVTASELLVQIRTTEGDLEEMRKSAKGPFLEMGKTIDNVFKPLIKTCARMREDVAGKMLAYGETEQAEYEARQKAAMAKEIEARKAGEPIPPQVEAPEPVTRTDSGKTFTRKRLKFEIIDEVRLIKAALDRRNQIPLDVATVNEAKLRECVNGKLYKEKQWARYGVRVYEVEEVTTRRE